MFGKVLNMPQMIVTVKFYVYEIFKQYNIPRNTALLEVKVSNKSWLIGIVR